MLMRMATDGKKTKKRQKMKRKNKQKYIESSLYY